MCGLPYVKTQLVKLVILECDNMPGGNLLNGLWVVIDRVINEGD